MSVDAADVGVRATPPTRSTSSRAKGVYPARAPLRLMPTKERTLSNARRPSAELDSSAACRVLCRPTALPQPFIDPRCRGSPIYCRRSRRAGARLRRARAVALGAFLGGLGVGAGGGEVAGVEVEPGQEVVDVGLLQTVLASPSDAQGFLGVTAGGLRLALRTAPAGPGKQDVGLDFDEVDPAAAGEGFGEVLFGLGQMLIALAGLLRRQGLPGPAEQPFGLDDVALVTSDIGEFARLAGGFRGRLGGRPGAGRGRAR